MFVSGDYLYVTAHSKGIRIFDISDRVNPVMVGRIDSGFVDAFAIHVEGDTAYVADGAGGLKIVDVTDRTAPSIIDGEDLSTAEGTSQDVTMKDGQVYVAAGGAGLAIYQDGDLTKRTHRHCSGCAKHFAWVGDYLAMTTMWRVLVFSVDGLGGVEVVGSESISRRGTESQLRTCGGIGAIYDDLLLAANWDFMDVYKLRPATECVRADINCWPQRIRFNPSGGKKRVWVQNNSYLPVDVTNLIPSDPSFSLTPLSPTTNGTLDPGRWASFFVTYDGSVPVEGAIGIYSNDQDENPFPIQVFGETDYLDPSEPAIDFTFPMLRKDPQGGFIEEQFTLSDHFGKVIWFNLYASW